MKVVIDTNIIINVLLSPNRNSASFKVFEKCLLEEINPQISAALFCEYLEVCGRAQIVEKSHYSQTEIDAILDGFFSVCKWTKINYVWRPNLRDEEDNHLVDLALASNARTIISYNLRDLTSGELKFHWQAVTPEQFLQQNV